MAVPNNRFPWLYLLLAYVLAWIIWIPVALAGRDYRSSPLLVFLLFLGAFGPGLAGIILTYREEGRRGGREFWRRAIDYRLIRPAWAAMILLFFPGLSLVAIVQFTLGTGLDLWIFIAVGLAWSVYSTWCYNHNGRSTLAVILLHAAYNLGLALFSEPGAERRILFLIVIFGASVVAAVWALHLIPYSREIGQEVVSRSGGIFL